MRVMRLLMVVVMMMMPVMFVLMLLLLHLVLSLGSDGRLSERDSRKT